MPGMIFRFSEVIDGKLQACFTCEKCQRTFAFVNGEQLFCPRCKGRGYPLNLDPEKQESHGLIVTP